VRERACLVKGKILTFGRLASARQVMPGRTDPVGLDRPRTWRNPARSGDALDRPRPSQVLRIKRPVRVEWLTAPAKVTQAATRRQASTGIARGVEGVSSQGPRGGRQDGKRVSSCQIRTRHGCESGPARPAALDGVSAEDGEVGLQSSLPVGGQRCQELTGH
jgi:hypothetical protein